MSDAEGRIIPLVEDDQGEEIKDFIEDTNLLQRLKLQEAFKKGKTENEMLTEILDRLGKLESFVKHALGGHVLIKGQWKQVP